MSSLSPVQAFYKDSTILLTGGSGFVGNGILEKLIRSCPNIKRIYLLMRPKKGIKPDERLEQMLNVIYFDKMKKENPNYKNIITIVNGDFLEDNLGLCEQDLNTIINEVNIIINSAATVKFDEKMSLATKVNIIALRYLIKISKLMRNLKSFVHVSTAYSRCYDTENKEEFHLPLRDPIEFIEYVLKTSEEELENQKPSIIQEFPNTYSFTKSLAEDIIRREGKDLPICVVRPSIVLGSWEEPIRGWANSLAGPFGIMTGTGYGLVRTIWADTSRRFDIVPIDVTANAIIAAGCETAKITNNDDIKIYNVVTSDENPVTLAEFFMWSVNFAYPYVPAKSLWTTMLIVTKYRNVYEVLNFFLHTIPGYAMDFALKITGKKPMFMNIYNRLHKTQLLLKHFSHNEFKFEDNNTRELFLSLEKKDQLMFNFDMAQIEWDLFLLYNVRGVRTILMKDPISTVPQAFKKMRRKQMVNHIFFILFVYLIYYLCCKIFS